MRWTVGFLAGAIMAAAAYAVTIAWNDTAGVVVFSVGMWVTLFLLLLAFGWSRDSSTAAARQERQRVVAAFEQMSTRELLEAAGALDTRERDLVIADDLGGAFAVRQDKLMCRSVLRNRGVRYPF
jgi:flavin reductase (DIM6/NTAB) family NADH-FMN oxidoreductase RutF